MFYVLVTGANRGIGLALTQAFLAAGDFVIATCRSPKTSAALAQLAAAYPQTCAVVALDVTDAAAQQRALAQISQKIRQIDILVNNAGILRPSQSWTAVSATDLHDSFAVNTIAPLAVSQTFLPLLRASANAKIVNITMPTSAIEKLSRTENHAYIASRYALNGLTKMMAQELGAEGIVAVGLYPGYIKTDMNDHADAAVAAETAVPLLVDLIHGLEMAYSGTCLLSNGRSFPW